MPHLTRRTQAAVLVAAAVAGYTGAAVYSALASPTLPPLLVATDFGPGDGLTRYVVTAATGDVAPLLGVLEAVPGVAHAQSLDEDTALAATEDLTPDVLRAVGGVAGVEPSTSVPVLGTVTDPYWPQYGWNLENTGTNSYNQPAPAVVDADVDATTGWEAGTGEGMVVAVVDTGFDSDHPDLAGALWTNPDQPCGTVDTDGNGLAGDCHGWNYYTNSADVDNGAHGSHGASVSGVLGARAGNGVGTAGVAPDVTIMPLVIGGGSSVDVNMGAKAIRYAVDQGADVINASWGGAFTGAPLQALRDAVAYAAAHDVLVVAAAGNDGQDRDTSILYPAGLTDPNVVTVGSSTAADGRSPTSAYGATTVDLFAPGFLVATTWNDGGIRLVGGTSIAAPQVAAAYALYRATMPTAEFPQLKQALLADVDPVPAFQGRSVTGGRLTTAHLADDQQGPVRYAFSATNAPAAGPVTPMVAVSGSTVAGSFTVTLGLGMAHEGEVWAVADEPVTLDGATLSTDDAGEVEFTLGSRTTLDGLVLSPGLDLGEGRYVLTVQLHRDGDPLGRTTAVPVLVGQPAVQPPALPGGGTTPPGGTAPGGTTPGGTTPGGTTPGTGGGTTPPGGSTPGGTTPDGGSGGTTPPGSTTPGTGGTAPGDGGSGGTTPPGGTTPGTGGGTTPDGGTPGDGTTPPGSTTPGTGGTAPGDGGSGGTTPPGGPTPGGTTPGGTAPGSTPPGSTPPGSTSPGSGTTPGGMTTYPEVGPFRVTSISPTQVPAAGGTTVTVTGQALPEGARVRVGDSAAATVVSSSATRLVFRTPARVAGTYDVHLFAPDDTAQVLTGALQYLPASAGSTPPGAGGGIAPPPTGGGTDPGTGGTTPPGTTPPGTTPPGTTPGPGTGGTAPGGGSAGPSEVTGPHGERLVRTSRYTGLGAGFWQLDCSSSCAGTAL